MVLRHEYGGERGFAVVLLVRLEPFLIVFDFWLVVRTGNLALVGRTPRETNIRKLHLFVRAY